MLPYSRIQVTSVQPFSSVKPELRAPLETTPSPATEPLVLTDPLPSSMSRPRPELLLSSHLVRVAQWEGGGRLQPEGSSRRWAIAGEVVPRTPPSARLCPTQGLPVLLACQQGGNKRELFSAWSLPPGSRARWPHRLPPRLAAGWAARTWWSPAKRKPPFSSLAPSQPARGPGGKPLPAQDSQILPGSPFEQQHHCLQASMENAHVSGTGQGADILEVSNPERSAGNSTNTLP